LFLCRLIDSSTSASVALRMALYKFDLLLLLLQLLEKKHFT